MILIVHIEPHNKQLDWVAFYKPFAPQNLNIIAEVAWDKEEKKDAVRI